MHETRTDTFGCLFIWEKLRNGYVDLYGILPGIISYYILLLLLQNGKR